MRQQRFAALLAVALLAGAFVAAHAQDNKDAKDNKDAAPATPAARKAKTCKTALDLIASQNTNLPLHPVFQNILNSEDLKGTIFIPTTKAWDKFFTTMRQRQGNPAAPAMVTRYGQILLYHLAKDVNVPIAEATPGANKFAVDTASTLQCTFGPGLPNNRLVIRKTPTAIIIQHGTGNATIMSQRIPYCGGEAYLVDQVLLPCGDIAAVMGEIANIPSPCRNNVEGVLNKNGLSYFNALLLATGVQRPVFSSVRNFTLFAPTDKAIQQAFRSGSLNYPYLFARNKTLLEGIVAYHTVPQFQFAGPSKQTINMKTLLSENTGEAKCSNPSLSWRSDGHVYGGTGSALVNTQGDRGCNTKIFPINEVLQPCCKPMEKLIGGADGLAARAPKDSIQSKAYYYLSSKVKGGAAGTTFIMPSAEAWAQFEADAAKQNVTLSDAKLDALFSYLITRVPISAQSLNKGVSVPMNLAAEKKALAGLCPKSKQKGSLVFAIDTSASLAATSDVGQATRAPAPRFNEPAVGAGAGAGAGAGMGAGRPAMGAGAGGMGGIGSVGAGGSQTLGAAPARPMAGQTLGASSTLGAAPAGGMGGGMGGGFGAGAGPAMGAGAGINSGPQMGVGPQRPMGGGDPAIPGLGPLRRLMQAVLGGARPAAGPLTASNQRTAQVEEPATTSEEDPSVFSDLLLPTTYQTKADTLTGGAGIAAATGPIVLMDGQEQELQAGLAIPVTSTTFSCDGAIFHTDAVPLPCNLLNRTIVAPVEEEAPLAQNITEVLPAQASANATLVVNATEGPLAPNNTATKSAAVKAVVPVAYSVVAAVVLGMLLVL